MLNRIFSIILAAFFVVSITGCYDAGAVKIDAQVMPKIDGCTLERFEVFRAKIPMFKSCTWLDANLRKPQPHLLSRDVENTVCNESQR